MLQTNDDWGIACASFAGTIDNHYPTDPLIQFSRLHPLVFPKVTSPSPLQEALLIFTDGSATGQAAYVIQGKTPVSLSTSFSSAQLVELYAVLQVLQSLPNTTFNLYTDSSYIAHSVPLLETTPFIKPSSNAADLFKQIQYLIV